ncbi:MAG: hypothetical protein KAQ82_02530 [Dehalococcoidia bacterium]|jgi:uncharacterized membrane protein YbaN (DUF454 family)|nr:hypothetical protein [Dehalococcoidia bacterium]
MESIIELGIFLVCLGATVCLLAKASALVRRSKAFAREQELERKKE